MHSTGFVLIEIPSGSAARSDVSFEVHATVILIPMEVGYQLDIWYASYFSFSMVSILHLNSALKIT